MKNLKDISGMPQMGAAFAGWTSRITLSKITEVIKDGLVSSVSEEICFNGVIQPLSAEKILLKPEGQRSFQWLQIHCFATKNNLATNDRIVYNGRKFKIMAEYDYSLDNFIEYHAIQDFEDGQ